MEAFLLSAGLGTRLKPLTNNRPKALVEVGNKTLLETNLHRLVEAGASRIVVNIHHFADMVAQFVTSRDWGTEVILSDERQLLLDTGAGLKKALSFLSKKEPVLVHNVDIVSDLDLVHLVYQHTNSMNIATLAVSHRDTSRMLLFDTDKHLAGWNNKTTNQFIWTSGHPVTCKPFAFSGIAIIDPDITDLLPPADHPYPIIPEYLRISKDHTISYVEHDPSHWIDVGKPNAIALANNFLQNIHG